MFRLKRIVDCDVIHKNLAGLGPAFFIPMSRFYKTRRWRKKRAQVLRRDKFMCQLSKRYGESVDATTVHHIFPIEFYPELKLVTWNLISLSSEAHDRMHDRDGHCLTEEGESLKKRYEPQYLEWCRENGENPH